LSICCSACISGPTNDTTDVLANPEVGDELEKHVADLKSVVLEAIEADTFIPAMSQTLEWFKYETSTELPTQFMEAQLDYFGEHMFETKGHASSVPEKGQRHYEWRRALGLSDESKNTKL
jgi:6-phosphogluconate dehydrogenase